MYNKFVSFLKQHNLYDKKVFKYFWDRAILFDYRDEDMRWLINCYYLFDKNNYLKKVWTYVPYVENDTTILINIHEYVHVFLFYKKLGKKVKIGMDAEVLPILFEKIYIMENPTQELINYEKYLNECIINNDVDKYIIGLNACDELINSYDNNANINKLERKAKKLARKYKRKK